jgi:phosphoglycerate dehydrogenase-like enzyme
MKDSLRRRERLVSPIVRKTEKWRFPARVTGMKLDGKRVMVGSAGIGHEVARLAKAPGAQVTIFGRSVERLSATVALLDGEVESEVVAAGDDALPLGVRVCSGAGSCPGFNNDSTEP